MYPFVLASYRFYYNLVHKYLNDATGHGDLRTTDKLNKEMF
jgi:hypothetical protein